ncbi:hypothetical protein [Gordonia alkaliphila]
MADKESDLYAFFARLHAGLPRQAPGSAATTDLLLRLAGPLPPRPSSTSAPGRGRRRSGSPSSPVAR